MNKKELLFVIGITIICHILLCFVFRSWRLISILNLILSVFYILFATAKLPKTFYKQSTPPTSKIELAFIWIGVFFLISCLIASVFPVYTKIIGRVSLIVTLLFMVAIMMYVYFNRLFGDLPKSMFKKYHVYYLRLILILLTNFYIFPICTFSYKVSYSQSGKLQYKEIKDGQNVYTTEYVDSLRCYVTHAVIDDSDEKDIRYLEYNIIYDKYPDKIARIDTIKIVKRK